MANAGNRLPEQRRVVRHVPQYDTLCVHVSWVRFPLRGKALSVVHSFQATTGPKHTHISGNCGSSCDKTFGGDLRPCSAVCVGLLCVYSQWQLYVAAPVEVLVTDRNSCMI